ncbi:MAG: hypothetical protein PHR77_14610 [Kiritimatiellae bacterium]|nr:hypothetical protein [Kiritimatiellia bacterium]MDD5520852.1 hypothetical protein [Kiritimatiellia bacterium]
MYKILIVTTMVLLAVMTACLAGENNTEQLSFHATVARTVEKVHDVLWGKFIGTDGLIHDFAGEIPTPEDCASGRPNAIGWWSPIENGPMFTGSYLAAMCERARRSGSDKDKADVKKLVKGLLKTASVSDVPGFVARGFATDGRSHYPLGSQDQTHPWFYGLYVYVKSGIPDETERAEVVNKMVEVAGALEKLDWKCPCDGIFKGQNRGDFKSFRNHGVVMYLFNLMAMYDVTRDKVWLERYRRALTERSPASGKTRLEICAEGYHYDERTKLIPNAGSSLLWIYVSSQGGLARLARMETDESVRTYYVAGLQANAKGAFAYVPDFKRFDNKDNKVFGHANWRDGYGPWFEQKTQHDAEVMAGRAVREKLGKRKSYESAYMRHPLASAAIVALGGYESGYDLVRRAICHYDYSRLNMAELFFAECAYYALPD